MSDDVITGGRVTALEAKRLKDGESKGLNVNIIITSIQRDGDQLKVAYDYVINYVDEIAQMRISGELFLKESEDYAKRVEKDWSERRYVEPSLAESLLTAMNYAASAVGTLAAFAIGVSAPIQVPKARIAAPAAA